MPAQWLRLEFSHKQSARRQIKLHRLVSPTDCFLVWPKFFRQEPRDFRHEESVVELLLQLVEHDVCGKHRAHLSAAWRYSMANYLIENRFVKP